MAEAKISITLSIPYDRPNANNVVISYGAIRNMIDKFEPIPIVSLCDECDNTVVGIMTSCDDTYDISSRTCKLELNGRIFDCV